MSRTFWCTMPASRLLKTLIYASTRSWSGSLQSLGHPKLTSLALGTLLGPVMATPGESECLVLPRLQPWARPFYLSDWVQAGTEGRHRGLGVRHSSRAPYHDRGVSLTVWVKPTLLTNATQLVTYETGDLYIPGREAGAALKVAQTVVAATSMTVAAALGFTRQQRRAFFIQQCLFKHLRRYMILLAADTWDAVIFGVSASFRAYWRTLTRPSMELFLHPLTAEVVADLGLSRVQLARVGSLEGWVAGALHTSNWLTLHEPGISHAGLALQEELARHLANHFATTSHWQRYTFEWARLYILPTQAHGYRRCRRARSIKRRQTKRLVRQTRYRFWPH